MGFTRMSHTHNIFFAALILAAVLSPTPARAEGELALHKAIYELRMKTADPSAGLNGINGKMYFEQDATCDAWTTEHRFTTDYQYAETAALTTTSRYIAFESKDGKIFSFNASREEEGDQTEQIRGSVERRADGTADAIYSRPEGTSYSLPAGYYLPTAQTLETLRRARAGEHFFSVVMFDGTDEDGPVELSTFIGKKATPDEIKSVAGKNGIDAALLPAEAWHVRMALFPLIDRDESEPAYEMDVILHGNGVISHALIDYKTFTVEQTLTGLEKLPPPKKCN